jgi:hypothetical protein
MLLTIGVATPRDTIPSKMNDSAAGVKDISTRTGHGRVAAREVLPAVAASAGGEQGSTQQRSEFQ